MKRIKITSRLGEVEGYTNEKVAYFDRFDSEAGKTIRHFILLDENIKLMYEPWGWKNEWYADLISIKYISNFEIEIIDLYIDIIIEGNGPTYRIIDFEDVAEALINKHITAEELETPFNKLQKFLDNHLHRARDFPPAIIKPYILIE